ncbi:HVO_0649 family zinc finger protein [Haloglomus litoreum]|uniref:HVO_0649 family zinc finger protein n=1 Tax=Haloglomus litoreum TaxID=3034026 RepID=UPI0023E8BFBF|nr:HVO_0649 family zinc finger protein [Haloglomus sp. DT116]
MTVDRSPMERLQSYYDDEELVCPECGFEDDPGSWESETDGRQVHYHHECPSCGAVREHTLDLPADGSRNGQ